MEIKCQNSRRSIVQRKVLQPSCTHLRPISYPSVMNSPYQQRVSWFLQGPFPLYGYKTREVGVQQYRMNFFKQLGSAVDKLNEIGKMTHAANVFGSPKPDPLTELIRSCSYPDEVKFMIEKSVKQVTQVYPSFAVDKLEYAEGGFQKRFIEVKGEIHVELRGKVKLNIMYPATFPKSAPYLRIINPNPNQFAPVEKYLPLQSKNDTKSFVLNETMDTVKKWNSSTSVVSLVIEASNLIKVNFPFQPKGVQQQRTNSWGSSSGGYNQGFSQNTNQYPPNMYPPNQSPPNQYPKQPPIPFQTVNYATCYPKATQLVTSQRKRLQDLKALHEPTLSTVQALSASVYALEAESSALHNQNQKMLEFVYASSSNENFSLQNVVAPADRISEQILDLTASIKAREDAIHLLEGQFNDERIPLEVFMKNARKMEEAKFEEKALLIKCLTKVSMIHP